MSENTVTAAEVCEAADCKPSTLRAWHNRLHLLSGNGQGWRRYTLEDLLTIRVMVILTTFGLSAVVAVDIAHSIQKEIRLAASGWGHKFAIARNSDGSIRVEKIDQFSSAGSALDFEAELTLVIDLHYVTNQMVDRIRNLRGMPPVAQSIVLTKRGQDE